MTIIILIRSPVSLDQNHEYIYPPHCNHHKTKDTETESESCQLFSCFQVTSKLKLPLLILNSFLVELSTCSYCQVCYFIEITSGFSCEIPHPIFISALNKGQGGGVNVQFFKGEGRVSLNYYYQLLIMTI